MQDGILYIGIDSMIVKLTYIHNDSKTLVNVTFYGTLKYLCSFICISFLHYQNIVVIRID